MNTIDLSSNLRMVGGVRFEGTNLRTVSFDQVANTLSFQASGSYLTILPSAAIRYAITPSTNFRISYSRGLSRPDPQDIAQAVTYTTIGSPGITQNTVTLGNPNLKAETADSIDVLIEHYLNPFGMISAGYFYKNLTNPIVQDQFFLNNFSPNPLIAPQTFLASQPINAGSAWLNGVEFAYLEHLTFLPGALKGSGNRGELQLRDFPRQRIAGAFGSPETAAGLSEYLEHQPDLRSREIFDPAWALLQSSEYFLLRVSGRNAPGRRRDAKHSNPRRPAGTS